MEHLAQEAGETVILPKFWMVHKILTGVEQFPQYKMFEGQNTTTTSYRVDQTQSRGNKGRTTPHTRNNVSLGTQNTQHTQHQNSNNINSHNNNQQ